MKITKTQIEAVYEVAVKIFADLVKLESGVKLLQEQYQWNPTSARYYLSRIAKDQGPIALQTAVRAVRKHIKYYKSVSPATLRSLSLVAAKYELSVPRLISFAEEEDTFCVQVNLALSATTEQRQVQLNASPKLPERETRLVEVFKARAIYAKER